METPSDRYQMEVGPKNAVLIVKKAERSDEGPYKVELENEQGSTTADTNVKVLSKYKKYMSQLQETLDQRNTLYFKQNVLQTYLTDDRIPNTQVSE